MLFGKKARKELESTFNISIRQTKTVDSYKQNVAQLTEQLKTKDAEYESAIVELEKQVADQILKHESLCQEHVDEKSRLEGEIESLKQQVNQEHVNEKIRLENEMALLKDQLREQLNRDKDLQNEIAELNKQNDDLQQLISQNSQDKVAFLKLEQENNRIVDELTATKEELLTAQQQAIELNDRNTELQVQHKLAAQEYVDEKSRLEDEIDLLKQQAGKNSKLIDQKEDELLKLQGSNNEMSVKLATTNEYFLTAQKDVIELNKQNIELKLQIESLKQDNSYLSDELVQVKEAKNIVEDELFKYKDDTISLIEQKITLSNRLLEVMSETQVLTEKMCRVDASNALRNQIVEDLQKQFTERIGHFNYKTAVQLRVNGIEMEEKNEPKDTIWLGLLWNDLSECYSQAEKYDQALLAVNKAIEYNSSNAGFFWNRASCFILLNNRAEAIKDLKKAVELNPKFEEAKKLISTL